MTIRITSPYFVAGYDMTTGEIAPIIRYMKGWKLSQIMRYCEIKRWKLEIIE